MEFVDDLQTFADLGMHLQSHGCHVANLSSVDFSAKNGIGGCLKSLSRQILKGSIDVSFVTPYSNRDSSFRKALKHPVYVPFLVISMFLHTREHNASILTGSRHIYPSILVYGARES